MQILEFGQRLRGFSSVVAEETFREKRGDGGHGSIDTSRAVILSGTALRFLFFVAKSLRAAESERVVAITKLDSTFLIYKRGRCGGESRRW